MFVIYIRIICRYFVGHGSCICILCEIWSLKIYEKCVWVFCEECVYKIYGSVRLFVLCNWLFCFPRKEILYEK